MRFFDHWLKGRDTGVEHDPRLVIYMQHWHPPDPNLESVPGEWRREDVWPPKDAKSQTLFMQPNYSLTQDAPADGVHELKYVPSVGVEAGFWWGELLSDVRPVDAFSLVYDSAPLKEMWRFWAGHELCCGLRLPLRWPIGLRGFRMWLRMAKSRRLRERASTERSEIR